MNKKFTLFLNANKGRGQQYARGVRHLPWVVGLHAFLFAILFIVIAVFLGEILFYNYVFLPRVKKMENLIAPIRFNKNAYNSVIKEWQVRDETLVDVPLKKYANPFNRPTN